MQGMQVAAEPLSAPPYATECAMTLDGSLTVTQFPGEKCTNIGKAVNALKRKMHHISMGKLNEQSLCNKFSVSLIRLSYFIFVK